MNNAAIQIKVKERLNKLDSKDYDNIECWQIVEAFNKAQIEWCRRQLVGSNILRQGDEQSKRRVSDLETLLTTVSMELVHAPLFSESSVLPADFLEFKRLELFATKDCCKEPRLMTVYLGEEANAVNYLKDENKRPSYDWGETFITLIGNKVRVYTGGDFTVASTKMVYYTKPRNIQIIGCVSLETQQVVTVNVTSELKDDVIEVIIDDTVAILAGDIEAMNQYSRESQAAEKNN